MTAAKGMRAKFGLFSYTCRCSTILKQLAVFCVAAAVAEAIDKVAQGCLACPLLWMFRFWYQIMIMCQGHAPLHRGLKAPLHIDSIYMIEMKRLTSLSA